MTNKQRELIARTADYARRTLGREATGHDWLHVERVWLNAKALAKGTKADMFIVELAALLHDIADWKFHGGDAAAGPKKTAAWLRGLRLDEVTVDRVADIVAKISFKGAKVKNAMDSLEGKIVQDADRLDALGAIGIARAFAYGGSKGREIYNPEVRPVMHASAEAYSKSTGPTINHFHEKLLLLEGLMNTRRGKAAARGRHRFMVNFLRQFDAEVSGRM